MLVDLVLHFDGASAEGGPAEEAAGVAVNEDGVLLKLAGGFAFDAGVLAGGSGGGGVPFDFAAADELSDGRLRC
jgi:hypothetical protein